MPHDFVNHLLPWLLVPVGLLALVYVFGPVFVWSIARIKRDPTTIPFDPERTPAPAAVQEELDRSVAALQTAGFELVSYLVLPDMVPDVKSIAVLLVRREEDVQSLINVSIGTVGGQAKMQDRCIEFITAFADGFEHHTLWNLMPPPLPPLPHKSILQVDSDDAGFLWRVHRAAVEAKRTAKNRPLPADIGSPEYVARETAKTWMSLTEIGWAWIDERRNQFRLTAKGACLMTWGMLWPVSRIRRAARRRRNRRLFAEWDVTDRA